MSLCRALAIALIAVSAAACGERPQTVTPAKKADAKAWQGTQEVNVAAGWKSGDHASWETQMRQRAQSQNEYVRMSPLGAEPAPAKAP
jgi:hypothetical protein